MRREEKAREQGRQQLRLECSSVYLVDLQVPPTRSPSPPDERARTLYTKAHVRLARGLILSPAESSSLLNANYSPLGDFLVAR